MDYLAAGAAGAVVVVVVVSAAGAAFTFFAFFGFLDFLDFFFLDLYFAGRAGCGCFGLDVGFVVSAAQTIPAKDRATIAATSVERTFSWVIPPDKFSESTLCYSICHAKHLAISTYCYYWHSIVIIIFSLNV